MSRGLARTLCDSRRFPAGSRTMGKQVVRAVIRVACSGHQVRGLGYVRSGAVRRSTSACPRVLLVRDLPEPIGLNQIPALPGSSRLAE